MTEQDARGVQVHRGAGLFDLRWILALLFAIYGAVLTIIGIGFTSEADVIKAAGIQINLWAGLGMLLMSLLFAVWARLRPVVVDPSVIEHHDTDKH
ncbi:hypothetical protein [Actinoalloteichus hymeniacidonis]|uniref:Uncharacterized protein n=1 Tax=Actinoalloteichus hymeniacidonis TaxID=340345 RepID=A0AAC9HN73_9PSEU|nr:hypothetical protein [Actinoalloteichus hymeniacidonis]AOS62302.1 hypothetical protein TL08_07420 [Actinoalloteichus hymeniacidonis]MBB5909672.1 hypothetical protein [Actinoalloteichus hymeniacidonis]